MLCGDHGDRCELFVASPSVCGTRHTSCRSMAVATSVRANGPFCFIPQALSTKSHGEGERGKAEMCSLDQGANGVSHGLGFCDATWGWGSGWVGGQHVNYEWSRGVLGDLCCQPTQGASLRSPQRECVSHEPRDLCLTSKQEATGRWEFMNEPQ